METTNIEPSNSVLTPEVQGAATIGARPVDPQAVVSPIRRRFRSAQAVWYILGVIEVILVARFVLSFIGANQAAGFTRFISIISFPFAGPFLSVVKPSTLDKNVFDWSLLLAMIVYALVAWGVVKLLVMSKPISDQDAHTKLDRQE